MAKVATPISSLQWTATPTKPTTPPPPYADIIDKDLLRKLVADCIKKQMYSSARFYADKLVTFTRGDPNDVYLLAQTYFLLREYRRAVHILRQRELLEPAAQLRFKYLAAQCLAECEEWDECLAVLGEDEERTMQMMQRENTENDVLPLGAFTTPRPGARGQALSDDTAEGEINIKSALCLLRAKIYDGLGNRSRAILWYKQALLLDVQCFEALDCLVSKQMLNRKQEQELLSELEQVFPTRLNWLKLVYRARLQETDHTARTRVMATIQTLETDYGLSGNLDLLAGMAKLHYSCNDCTRCDRLSNQIIAQDPYHQTVLPAYLCSLVEQQNKSRVFYMAHQLVEAYPDKAIAWFSVACYYYLIGKFDLARRYFSKCTSLDHYFAPGWIGFGHAFAAQDESDQAMAAYRTANRLFEGSHVPKLCIGIEYLRTSHDHLANQFFMQAHACCPSDPHIYNELGVVAYRISNFELAVEYLTNALKLFPSEAMESAEPIMFNLAHAHRKLKDYRKAIEYYEKALSVAPRKFSVYTALAFTYHLRGDLDAAIETYHKALALQPRDTLTQDLLTQALDEIFAPS